MILPTLLTITILAIYFFMNKGYESKITEGIKKMEGVCKVTGCLLYVLIFGCIVMGGVLGLVVASVLLYDSIINNRVLI